MLIQSALVALAATLAGAVKPLEVQGQNFVDPDTGYQFEIVGMAYQPGGTSAYNPDVTGMDVLSDPDACRRDAALMQVLGINAIRVYNLSPDLNHDECVSIFNAAGMYMMIDVNSPLIGDSLTTDKPWESYYMEYLNRTFAIVEAFSNYPNTLLYFSSNEVINDIDSAEFVPRYIRAVTRDIRNYIKNNIERKIPVGYSAADVREVLWDTYAYLECHIEDEDDDMSRAEIFALNSYSWCGADATFQSSTFDDLVDGFKESSIPVFFSEYGCIKDPPRLWEETQSIYGEDMYDVFSGGVVYEWTYEKNMYGIVNITGDETQILSDYNRLREQFEKIDWEAVQTREAPNKEYKPPTCSQDLIDADAFGANFTIPDVPPDTQELIDNGIKNKPSGKLIDIDDFTVTLRVIDNEGNEVTDLAVAPLADDEFNWLGKNEASTGTTKDSDDDDNDDDSEGGNDSEESNDDEDDEGAASAFGPMIWAAAVPVVAMLLA